MALYCLLMDVTRACISLRALTSELGAQLGAHSVNGKLYLRSGVHSQLARAWRQQAVGLRLQ